MTSVLPTRRNFPPQNVTFFEEIIKYVLRRYGIDLEPRRHAHLVRLRSATEYSVTPNVGEAVISIAFQESERIMNEVNPIWDYILSLNRNERGDVLQISIIIMGIKILNEIDDETGVLVLMAIVTQLCVMCCREDHPTLIGNAVSALQFIFSNAV